MWELVRVVKVKMEKDHRTDVNQLSPKCTLAGNVCYDNYHIGMDARTLSATPFASISSASLVIRLISSSRVRAGISKSPEPSTYKVIAIELFLEKID